MNQVTNSTKVNSDLRQDVKTNDLIDERISASLLRRKQKSEENMMKNRAKLYYVSCLEVKEANLDQISPEMKEKIQVMSDVHI